MKSNLVTKTLLTMSFLFLFTFPALAQTPAEKAVNSGAASAPSSLELTAEEKAFLKQLETKLAPINQQLSKIWNSLLATENEKEAYTLWLEARLQVNKSEALAKKFNEWFEKVKKAHNCLDCTLKDFALVKPLEKTPNPTPTPTPPTKP